MPTKKSRQVIIDETTGEWERKKLDAKGIVRLDLSSRPKPKRNLRASMTALGRRLSFFDDDDVLKTSGIRSGTGDTEDADADFSVSLMSLLFVSSVVASFLSFTVDISIVAIDGWKSYLGGKYWRFPVEACFDVSLIVIARLVVWWAPNAAGSGIPEVKCILSGGSLSKFLIWQVLVAKCVGLTCAMSAGLPLGKEGPFVHIAACVSAQLLRTERFKGLRGKRDSAEKVLFVAVSVGVGATFSAPISGMLFALELMMPHMYDLATYRSCFAASALGSCIYGLLKMGWAGSTPKGTPSIRPLISSNVHPETSANPFEEASFILTCMFIGALSGLLGGFFVRFHRFAAYSVKVARGLVKPPLEQPAEGPGGLPKQNMKSPLLSGISGYKNWRVRDPLGYSLGRDLVLCSVLALVGTAIRVFSGEPLFALPAPELITTMFNSHHQGVLPGTVAIVFLVKWVHSAVAISMPVPCGCVAPAICLGALFGRGLGLMMPMAERGLYASSEEEYFEYVARFAIVGAAGFAASVCQTISIVVTIFELISVPGMILPLILSTLTAVACSQAIAPSIYDSIIVMKNLPCLPALTSTHKGSRFVKTVMQADIKRFSVPRICSREELLGISSVVTERGDHLVLPIVEGVDGELVMVGAVDSASFSDALEDMSDSMFSMKEDMLMLFARNRHLVAPLQVEAHETVRDVYLEAQSAHYDRTMMVHEEGFIIGILSLEDIVNLGS